MGRWDEINIIAIDDYLRSCWPEDSAEKEGLRDAVKRGPSTLD